MKKHINIFLFLVVVSFFSCEEEKDCVGCNMNPKIKLKFEASATRELTDSLLANINGNLIELVDSLDTQLSADDRNNILAEVSSLKEDSSKYSEMVKLFKTGMTKINSIEAPGSSGFEQFQDSIIRDFSIPVDMRHDTSTYYFTYHGFSDTLQLYYQREIAQTFDGVRMRINGIGVNKELSTFDSIRVKCYNRDCSNDLTTVFIYF